MNDKSSTRSDRKPRSRFWRGCLYVVVGLLALALLVPAVLLIRRAVAGARIQQERGSQPAPLSGLQETSHLSILPLYDAVAADPGLETGFGVAYLVQTDSATILMDVGDNPSQSAQLPSLQNMQALGIPWETIDAVVLTHPHPDHVGGTQAWLGKTFSVAGFSGDLSNKPVYAPIPMTYTGASVRYSPQPALVASDIATTGVITFPDVFPVWVLDPTGHEQALVVHVTGKGLVLITGCGHPTLEALVDRAEAVFGQPVVGVVGGLHYQNAGSDALRPHIQYLEARHPALVALSPHDSSAQAIAAFESAFADAARPIRVGERIEFP